MSIDLNDGTHSRFKKEHYKNCEPCAEDHEDFVEQSRIDEQEDQEYDHDED